MWPLAALCGRPVRLTEGDTLYLRWQTGLGPLDGCAAVLPDGTETSLPDRATPAADRPRYAGDGYPSGQCGLRADNVTAGVGDWTLKATAADGRLDRHTSRVTCVGKSYLFMRLSRYRLVDEGAGTSTGP